MVDRDQLDCKIYAAPARSLAQEGVGLATALEGKNLQGGSAVTVELAQGELDLLPNPDKNPERIADFPNGFLHFPALVEFYAAPEIRQEDRIAVVSRILTHFWSRGIPAIAACDYEAELPNGGGYKVASVPWPRPLRIAAEVTPIHEAR